MPKNHLVIKGLNFNPEYWVPNREVMGTIFTVFCMTCPLIKHTTYWLVKHTTYWSNSKFVWPRKAQFQHRSKWKAPLLEAVNKSYIFFSHYEANNGNDCGNQIPNRIQLQFKENFELFPPEFNEAEEQQPPKYTSSHRGTIYILKEVPASLFFQLKYQVKSVMFLVHQPHVYNTKSSPVCHGDAPLPHIPHPLLLAPSPPSPLQGDRHTCCTA